VVDRDANLVGLLHLDPSALLNRTRLYEGYARVYGQAHLDTTQERVAPMREHFDEDNTLWDAPSRETAVRTQGGPADIAVLAASSYASAAVCRSLVDAQEAKELFREAAERYRALDNPYYVLLAICADAQPLVLTYLEGRLGTAQMATPETVFYDMVAAMYGQTIAPRRDVIAALVSSHEQAQQYRFAPVGRLRLPLFLYDDLYEEFARGTYPLHTGRRAGRNDGRAWPIFLRYSHRVGEVVGAAMGDNFHWSQLQSRILPIEPEAIALSLAVAALGRQQGWWTDFLATGDRNDYVLAPAIVAARLAPPRESSSEQGFEA
jgi:hypothetical protein